MKPEPWPLRELTLKVLDLSAQAEFYQNFGLSLLDRSDRHASFAAGDACLRLMRLTDGKPRPPRTAGLFHFALLLPDRPSLGAFLRFATGKPWHFVGAADHLVSESLYFSDPEKNGIEVYADPGSGTTDASAWPPCRWTCMNWHNCQAGSGKSFRPDRGLGICT
jgi:catechol 2,3-dioxygenase